MSEFPSCPMEFSPEHDTSVSLAVHENAWPPEVRDPARAGVSVLPVLIAAPELGVSADPLGAPSRSSGTGVGLFDPASCATTKTTRNRATTPPTIIAGSGTESNRLPREEESGGVNVCFCAEGRLRLCLCFGAGAAPASGALELFAFDPRTREKNERDWPFSVKSAGGAGGSGTAARFWTPRADTHQSRNSSHASPCCSRS